MELTRAEHAEGTWARPRVNRASGALVGSRCLDCGARSWPGRAVCSSCGSDRLALEELPGSGELRAYTRVWVPRKDLPAPYVLGEVDLGPGTTVFGHVRDLPEGAALPLTVRIVVPEQPSELRFWFVPAARGDEQDGRPAAD